MQYAYRCSQCNINWPREHTYQKCPACKSLCWAKKMEASDVLAEPEVLAELRQQKSREARQVEFEKYCERRDRESLQADIDRIASGGAVYVDDILAG